MMRMTWGLLATRLRTTPETISAFFDEEVVAAHAGFAGQARRDDGDVAAAVAA